MAIFIAVGFSNSLTKPINLLLGNMEKIKEGDFTIKTNLKTKDEIGKLEDVNNSFETINKSVEKITEKIKSIGEYVNDINTDKDLILQSVLISAVSEEVSASIHQQTSAIDEVAKSSENLSYLAVKLNDEISKFKI